MIRKFRVKVQDKVYEVEVEEIESTEAAESPVKAVVAQPPTSVTTTEPVHSTPKPQPVQPKPVEAKPVGSTSGEHVVKAPMPGLIIQVDVAEGNRVSVGQRLLVLEAMKMENDITADREGVVKEVHVKKGDNVELGQALVTIV